MVRQQRKRPNETVNPFTSCLGAVAAGVVTLSAACSAAVFSARDVVSTYFAEPARAMGLSWFAEQPRPVPGRWQFGGNSCELSWKKIGFETAKYRLTCLSDVDLMLSDFAIVSTLDPARTQDGEVFEYQGPMSGQEVRIESHRNWSYDGTIWLGSSLPFIGQTGPRHLVMTAKVSYPDATETHRKRLQQEANATTLELVASEPVLGIRR